MAIAIDRRRSLLLPMVVIVASCDPIGPTAPSTACAAMPVYVDDTSANAVEVPIKIVNGLGPHFEARSLCLSVDGQRVGTTDSGELGAKLRNHLPLEPRVRMSLDREHVILLNALYVGTGEFQPYNFQITSERAVAPAELRAETITASINEVTADGSRTPLEQRPQVEWSGPGHTRVRR